MDFVLPGLFIMGMREEDFAVPYANLSTEEARQRRRQHTSPVTTQHFRHLLRGRHLPPQALLLLKAKCIRHQRMDLLEVLLEVQAAPNAYQRDFAMVHVPLPKTVTIDESRNQYFQVPLDNDVDHNARAAENGRLLAAALT